MITPASSTASDIRTVTHEDIACRAYELWKREGHIHGNHEKHWHEAVHQVEGNPHAQEGNPAYPSLAERELIVDNHVGKEEPVKKIPAAALKKHAARSSSGR